MPALRKQDDLYPSNLLDDDPVGESCGRWWALYTRSRREKQLARFLHDKSIPFYLPVAPRRFRSAGGRVRTSYQPIFSNYVFISGDDDQRRAALTSNCVSRSIEVADGSQLKEDLRRIRMLIETGHPVTPEARIPVGARVRVLSGPFDGFEGVVVRREKEVRLLVKVHFMDGGASVLLDDCHLERVA